MWNGAMLQYILTTQHLALPWMEDKYFLKHLNLFSMHCKQWHFWFHSCSSAKICPHFQSRPMSSHFNGRQMAVLNVVNNSFKKPQPSVDCHCFFFLAIRSAEIHREDIEEKCEAVSAWLRYFLNGSHMFSWYSGKNRVFKQDGAKVSQL